MEGERNLCSSPSQLVKWATTSRTSKKVALAEQILQFGQGYWCKQDRCAICPTPKSSLPREQRVPQISVVDLLRTTRAKGVSMNLNHTQVSDKARKIGTQVNSQLTSRVQPKSESWTRSQAKESTLKTSTMSLACVTCSNSRTQANSRAMIILPKRVATKMDLSMRRDNTRWQEPTNNSNMLVHRHASGLKLRRIFKSRK